MISERFVTEIRRVPRRGSVPRGFLFFMYIIIILLLPPVLCPYRCARRIMRRL